MPNPLRMDPSRTSGIRRRFMADMRRRFLAVRRAIREALVDRDVLGLQTSTFTSLELPVRQAFRFQTDAQKVESFQRWFQSQVDQDILSVSGAGDPWTKTYVDSSYKQGVTRAYMQARPEAMAERPDFYLGSREEFLRSAFDAPETVSKLRLLNTRAFEQLKGVTAQMGQGMNRILSEGVARGDNARVIASRMTKEIDGLTKGRAMMIARTEVIHAHAEGQLDSFERLGVEEVGIMAEWSTAGDSRVCGMCYPLEGVVMKVQEARGMIPRHPNCRCAWTMAEEEDKGRKVNKLGSDERVFVGKKWDKKDVDKAIDKSIAAEGPRKKRRSFEETKARSSWVGKDVRISKDRRVGDFVPPSTPTVSPPRPSTPRPSTPRPKSIPTAVDVVAWKRSKNMSEIQDQFKKIGVSETVSNYAEARAVKMHNLLGEEWTRVLNENPRLKELAQRGKPVRRLDVVRGKSLSSKGMRNADGAYYPVTTDVDLAGGLTPKKLDLTIGGWDVEGGWDTSFQGTFRHEMGHHTHKVWAKSVPGQPSWETVWKKHPKSWWKTNVSEYGSTNEREAFAEAFAAYTHPDYPKAKRRLPEEIEKWFDAALKGE